MLIELLCALQIFIIIYCIFNIYKLIRKISVFNSNLVNNNIIIIWNRPYRTHINEIMLFIFENICNDVIFDINSHERIINKMRNKNNMNIIIDTYGGNITSNDILLNFIITSKIKLNIYVPNKAQSAGTLLSLSADKLYIDKYAYLGPTDPQITYENETYSIRSFMDLCNNKDNNFITDKYLLCYYDNKKLYDENIELCTKLLQNKFKKNISDSKKNELLSHLTSGLHSHHIPLSGKYISKFLNINLCLPKNITEIYNVFQSIKVYI